MSLNKERTNRLEVMLTRQFIELVDKISKEELCPELTAALIAALANCLVIFTHGGIADKEETLEIVSLAVNRANDVREDILRGLKVKITPHNQ